MSEIFRSSYDEIYDGTGYVPTVPDTPPPTPTGQMTGGDGTVGGTTVGSRISEPRIRTGDGTWLKEQAFVTGANGRITIVDTFGNVHPAYTKSYRFANNGQSDVGQVGGPNNQRTELLRPATQAGNEITVRNNTTDYLAFGLYLPTGFVARLTDNCTVWQEHPPVAQPTRLRIDKNGRLSARISHPPLYTSGKSKSGTKLLAHGGHIKIVIKVVWSSSAGSMDVWVANPGETAFTHDIAGLTGANMDNRGGYHKCGQYFADATQIASAADPIVTLMSNMIIGPSFASVAERAFGVTMV